MPLTQERQRANGVAQIPPTYRPPAREHDNSGYWAAFLLLGLLVVVLGFVAVWMGISAHDARSDANRAAKALSAGTSMADQRNIQTALVPAGGGGVFDVTIDQPGLYPFVSHSFASVDLGQVGLLNVGNVAGTMSH